jgi:ATP-dependent helicase/nuclease subunit B
VASAPEVILSVPETVDEAPVLASPLLEGIAALTAASHWTSPRLAESLLAQRPALETLVDVALPPLGADEGRRGGARVLELQSACPFRAQAEIRLGARVLESPGVGVDAAERGELVHRALALLWTRLGNQAALLALDAPGLLALVRHCVMAALAEARRTADELTRYLLDLEADWLEARVLEMVEADRSRTPFAVEAVEAPRTAVIGALALDLRLDRVDRLEDDSLAVIDYKTGANAAVASWLDERPRLPQLPAYVQALGGERVGAVAFARLRSGDTGYAGLARTAGPFPGLRVAGDPGWPRDVASWDELLGAWRRRLEALAAEHAAGDARLAPDPAQACRHCHLGALCRIAETAAVQAEEEAADE